jgi:GNAT superfamily N-acetyltransferase
VVGLVGGIDSELGRSAELVSMWVHPAHRHIGAGGRLVEAVVDWARNSGYEKLRLWVVEGNQAAESLYARCGFTRTGSVAPVREGEPQMEFEMALSLSL